MVFEIAVAAKCAATPPVAITRAEASLGELRCQSGSKSRLSHLIRKAVTRKRRGDAALAQSHNALFFDRSWLGPCRVILRPARH